MLELIDVAAGYGERTVLGPISLEVAAGGTTALVGPSGSGKSTLLRVLLGLLRPGKGTVRVAGEPLPGTLAGLAACRRRMGYVVQDGGLFPHLTAAGNVSLMARHVGWPCDRIERRIDALCELTRFPRDGLARYPAELSGGQRQRVGIMRALALDPEVLLLDEPLSSLDPIIRFELQEELAHIFEQLAKTVVLVTHDLAEAAFFGRDIVLLRDGVVAQRGSYEDLVARPADPFVRRFIAAQRGHGASGNV